MYTNKYKIINEAHEAVIGDNKTEIGKKNSHSSSRIKISGIPMKSKIKEKLIQTLKRRHWSAIASICNDSD